MSKLYKDLKYDTDWVMQPGDPITSLDGNTSVQAINGGKATITMPGLAEPGASLSNDVTLEDLIQLLDLPETSTLDDVRSVLGLSETATLYDASVTPITKDLVTSPVKWEDVSNKPTSFAPAAHEHSAANITSGTLSVARGGTGVDGSVQGVHKVLAAPSTGAAGAVSFRTLVASDIPDLNTSKLTAGTLGVARGGTGKASHTVNSILAGNASSTTGTIQNIATASGALYATSTNGQASFGTLPIAQGGTGATSASAARTNLEITAANIPFENDQTVGAAIRDLYDTTAWVDNDVLKVGATEIATLKLANNKTVATTDQLPSGTSPLPLAQGGTGATTAAAALTALGAAASDHTHSSLKAETNDSSGLNRSTLVVDASNKITLEHYNVQPSYPPTTGVFTILKVAGDYNAIDYPSNKVLAGPTNGTTGSLSFRKLVVADLPTHTHTVSQLTDFGSNYVPKCVSITYANLVTLRTNSQLIPGTTYRITDYGTTTAQADTQSAGHAFDLLVVADDVNKLNENAHAIQHSGDTYFANCKLAAWKIKYSLDNDTTRFDWASSSGKGVIYEMEDEWGNKCGYDFKNIQFKRYLISSITSTLLAGDTLTSLQSVHVNAYMSVASTMSAYGCTIAVGSNFQWCYTFNSSATDASDNSLTGSSRMNIINAYGQTSGSTFVRKLNNIVLRGSCFSNIFDSGCYNITTKAVLSRSNIHNSCYNITLGGGGYFQIGSYCHDFLIGGSGLTSARELIVGPNCNNIVSGQRAFRCNIGANCTYLSLSIYNMMCNFGQGCNYIHFGSASGSKGYYQSIDVGSNNSHIYLNCTGTTSTSAYYRNVTIGKGVNNSDTWKTITDANTNQNYETTYQAENSLVIPV